MTRNLRKPFKDGFEGTKVALVDDTGESYGRGGIPDPADKKGPKKWVKKPTKTKTT